MDGISVPAQHRPQSTLFEAAETGLYTAIQDETRLHIAVNFAGRTFSDVNRSEFQGEIEVAAREPTLRRELWFYMLLAAVFLIGAEWFTYHRRMTL